MGLSIGQAAQEIRRAVESEEYKRFFSDLLLALCGINTTAGRDPRKAASEESLCLGLVAGEAAKFLPHGACFFKTPIDPKIFELPEFTKPPHGFEPQEYFHNRCNLIIKVPGSFDSGIPMIYNAHIDTVAPYFPPRISHRWIFGRGAADDKAQIALLVSCMKLLKELERRFSIRVKAPRVYQFVIEEETGGNGTLSALMDEELRPYSALVLEVTSLKIHPANRGALWYQVRINSFEGRIKFAELAAYVILELEKEGDLIKKESKHPLFEPHHVQTCHGILGPYGEHPSAVNDYVALRVKGMEGNLVRSLSRKAVRQYCEKYGDKTQKLDSETGKPVLTRHFEIKEERGSVLLEVFGKAGHMGSIHKLDCALIKGAYLVRELFEAGARVELAEGEERDFVFLEGGQGFLPTHSLEEIKKRLSGAVFRGTQTYLKRLGLCESLSEKVASVRYEKLHNDAFESRLDSPVMQSLREAWEAAGRPWEEVKGWEVSCDARLFHRFGHDVVVWGVGDLSVAHGPEERISIEEAMEGLLLLSLFTLHAGGAF